MITAAAAVANGGYMVQPHVVGKIIDDDGNIVKTIDTSVKTPGDFRGYQQARQ